MNKSVIAYVCRVLSVFTIYFFIGGVILIQIAFPILAWIFFPIKAGSYTWDPFISGVWFFMQTASVLQWASPLKSVLLITGIGFFLGVIFVTEAWWKYSGKNKFRDK